MLTWIQKTDPANLWQYKQRCVTMAWARICKTRKLGTESFLAGWTAARTGRLSGVLSQF